MKRMHQRSTLMKNKLEYYKAFENMINLSVHKHTIFQLMPSIIGKTMFQITIDENGQHAICLEKLYQKNNNTK